MSDDNAYERRSQAQAAAAAPDAMDVELAPASRAAAPAAAAPSAAEPVARLASSGLAARRAEEGAGEPAAGDDEEERARGKLRKRVRFAGDAAPRPAEREGSSGAARWPWALIVWQPVRGMPCTLKRATRLCCAPCSGSRLDRYVQRLCCLRCIDSVSTGAGCMQSRQVMQAHMCKYSISSCVLIDERA